MKLLCYEWGGYLQYDIYCFCRENGICTESFTWKFSDKNKDEAFANWFREHVDEGRFDAVLSINYWPMLSRMAKEKGLKYIAWCYDNPLNVIDIEDTLNNPNNYVFLYDRIQTEQYLRAGFDTVYYLPLGVNGARLSRIQMSAADRRKYGAEAALVGSLYESRLQELRALADEYVQGYLDASLAAQQNLYGCYLFDEMVTEHLVERFNKYIGSRHPESSFRLKKEALTFALASEVTRRERLLLLTILGRRFDTRLYSFHESTILEGVKCFPPVDYVTEMPKVFACSKINLNPVLRCIQSGIPLRALDVMGMGGFLLSSWQPELAEYFENGRELVLYESVGDAVEKAGFYLSHEELREQIAARGRKKVLDQYTLQERMKQILQTAGISQG